MALVLSGSAPAATITWVGNTDVNWSGANWTPTSATSGDSMVFGAAGSSGTNLTNDLPAGTSIAGITFTASASSYTINGNALNLTGDVFNNGTAPQTLNLPVTITAPRLFSSNASGGDIILSGVVGGAGSLSKLGAGSLILSNPANTYTGETIFGAGIVNVASLADYGAPSSLGAREMSMENTTPNGISLHFRGGTLQYTGSTPQSTNRQIRILGGGAAPGVNNTIEASGSDINATLSFTHSGPNINLFDTGGHRTLTLAGTNAGRNTFSIRLTDQAAGSGLTNLSKSGPGTWHILNTDNTYTGETFISGGILNVASVSDYGVASSIGSRNFAQENSTLTGVSLHFLGGTLQYTGSTPQSTNRNIRILNGFGATIDASGSVPEATLSFTKTGANLNLFDTPGTRTLTLTGSNAGDNGFSIQLLDQAGNATSLLKTGTGTWVLNGPDPNAATGSTTVHGGILVLAKENAVAVSGELALGDGIGLDVAKIAGTGGNQIADTSVVNFTGFGTDSGVLRLNNHTETVAGISAFGSGIVENESGSDGTGVLTVNVPGTGAHFYSGILRDGDGIGVDGKLALVKAGAGSLTLIGDTSHTGDTTVTGGTLTVDGNFGAGSTIIVAGGTLNGLGSIAAPINVGNGGVLSASGTLAGPITLSTGSTLAGGSTITGTVNAGSGSRISPGGTGMNGTLSIGSLVLSNGSSVDYELSVVGDLIVVTGAGGLALNGGSLNLFEPGGFSALGTNGTYTLIDYNTSFTGSLSNLSVANSQAGKFYTMTDDTAATRIVLTVADAVISEWSGAGGDTQYTTGGNWSGVVPNAAGVVAKLGSAIAGPATVAVSGPKTVGGIVFDNINGYTLAGAAGDTITLNNGVAAASVTVTTGNHTIAVPIELATSINATTAPGTTLGFNGNISGAKPFVASGFGTTILRGSNTFTTTRVAGGTLQVGDNGTTGTLGSGDVTVETGGTLVFHRSDDIAVGNSIFGPGGQVIKRGEGALTLDGTNSVATGPGGSFRIEGGSVKLGSSGALPAGVILDLAGGTLDINGNHISPSLLSGIGGTVTDRGAVDGSSLITLDQSTDSTFGASITNGSRRTLSLTKTGTGTLTLTGSNNFSGPLTILKGAVIAAGQSGSPSVASNVILGDGSSNVLLIAGATTQQFGPETVINFNNAGRDAKFMLRGSNQTVGGLDSTANPSVSLAIIQNDEGNTPGYVGGAGPATLTINTLTDHSFAGLIRNGSGGGVLNLVKEGPGTQEIRNVLVLGNDFGTVTINAGKLTFNLTPNANNTNALGAGTNIFVNSGGTLGLDGNWNMNRSISGAGNVVKQGTDGITLSATNSYTGTTTIERGALTAVAPVGPSIPGNVVFGRGLQNGIFLIMGAVNQFGPESVLKFDNGPAMDAKLELRGFNQTVAGLSSDSDDTLSIIQNQESATANRGSATLTINTTGDYSFTGLIRSLGSAAGEGVHIVKTGNGTQEIRNIAAAAHNFGNATIESGKLIFNLSGVGNTLGAGTNIFVNNSATLGLDGAWTISQPVSGTGNVEKRGSGTVTVSGSFTNTGETNVIDGTLLVNGTIAGNVNVTGALSTLAGIGTVGPVSVANGASLAPGNNGVGRLNALGDVSLASGTNLILQINNAGGAAVFDELNVTGQVNLGASTLSLLGDFVLSLGAPATPFFVLLNDGADPIGGSFGGIPEGGLITAQSGQVYMLTYQGDSDANAFTGGNDVALLAIPEPGVAVAMLAGVGMLLGSRRRRLQT